MNAEEDAMDPERRRRVERIFDGALDLDPPERDAYLLEAGGGDMELIAAARRLLAAHELAEGVLDRAPPGLTALDGESFSDPPAQQPGVVGPYRILEEIGRGGMGTVHRAERADGHFRQEVAVKLLSSSLPAPDLVRRFLAERQILASLNHPNIAHLMDGGVAGDGRPYLVMEHVKGVPLDAYCDRERLTIADRLRLFCTIARAVQHAHRNLIVHRDLKPSNILVDEEGVPKLLDFGIAKLLTDTVAADAAPLTRTAQPMTPEYASPEQLRGEAVTTATDVYGLGLVLFELLAGSRPFRVRGRSAAEVERLICETAPPRLTAVATGAAEEGASASHAAEVARVRGTTSERLARLLSGDLERIVAAALRKEPERRYPSAEAFAADVEAYLEGRPVWARGDSRAYRLARFTRRHAWEVAAAAALVLLLAGYAVTTTVQAREVRRALQQASLERDKAEEVTTFLMSLFEASDPAEARGSSITARELLDRGVARAELLEGEPLVQARILEVIGRVYTALAEYERARPLLDRSLALREGGTATAAETAASLDALGTLYRLTGDFDSAEQALRRSLTLGAGTGEELATAKHMHDLAVLLADRGDYPAAEELHRHALEIRIRSLPEDDPGIGESLGGLAFLALQTGDYPAADSLYSRSLSIRRTALGTDHPDVAVTLNNLGSVKVQRGDLDAAERLHGEALAIRRSIFGPEHPATATSLNNLAHVALLREEFAAADSLLRQVVEIRRRTLGDEHPAVATAINNLAFLQYRRGDYTVAEPLFREVIERQRRTIGDRHPNTAGALHNLALVLRETGRTAEARRTLREAQAIRGAIFAADHPDIARGLHDLGMFATVEGDAVEAEQLLREALAMRERVLGREHDDTRASREALAALLETTAVPAPARAPTRVPAPPP